MTYNLITTNDGGIENLVLSTTNEWYANYMLDVVNNYYIANYIFSPFGYLASGRIDIITP